jgi:hypothetical protein
MADIASAGTYVGAVLETAGYLAQESILQTMGGLLQSTAVLFFVITLVGALVSITLFGSYKFAMHLLIAPPLFYFLLTAQGSLEATVFRIGGGVPRTENGEAKSLEEARKVIKDAALSKNGKDAAKEAKKAIAVALPFQIFTNTINNIISAISDIILTNENDKDLLYLTRTQTLGRLLDLGIEDGNLKQIITTDLIRNCSVMMNASLKLADPKVGTLELEELKRQFEKSKALTPPKQQAMMDDAIKALEAKIESLENARIKGKSDNTNPSPMLARYVREALINNPNSEESKGIKEVLKNLPSTEIAGQSLKCGTVWELTKIYLLSQSNELSKRLLDDVKENLTSGDTKTNNPVSKELCLALAEKAGKKVSASTNEEKCRSRYLVEIVSVLILRKALLSLSPSKLAQSMKDQMQYMPSSDPFEIICSAGQESCGNSAQPILVGGRYLKDTVFQQSDAGIPNSPKQSYSQVEVAMFNVNGEAKWLPYKENENANRGDFEVAFGANQQLQARVLRQEYFTLMAQFPYIQGVILYFLTMLYPFVAVLVLIPNRAGSFLNYLLCWTWVKSWDIGLSVIRVMDRVLWNLFPSLDFDENTLIGRVSNGTISGDLPNVLSEALRVDPTYSVHGYYFILTTATYIMPVIIGMFILKIRNNAVQEMISPLSQLLTSARQDAGRKVSSAFFGDHITSKTQKVADLEGHGVASVNPVYGISPAMSGGAKVSFENGKPQIEYNNQSDPANAREGQKVPLQNGANEAGSTDSRKLDQDIISRMARNETVTIPVLKNGQIVGVSVAGQALASDLFKKSHELASKVTESEIKRMEAQVAALTGVGKIAEATQLEQKIKKQRSQIYAGNLTTLMRAEYEWKKEEQRLFHPIYGKFSKRGYILDAEQAAMDRDRNLGGDQGEFEQHGASKADDLVNALSTRFSTRMQMALEATANKIATEDFLVKQNVMNQMFAGASEASGLMSLMSNREYGHYFQAALRPYADHASGLDQKEREAFLNRLDGITGGVFTGISVNRRIIENNHMLTSPEERVNYINNPLMDIKPQRELTTDEQSALNFAIRGDSNAGPQKDADGNIILESSKLRDLKDLYREHFVEMGEHLGAYRYQQQNGSEYTISPKTWQQLAGVEKQGTDKQGAEKQ